MAPELWVLVLATTAGVLLARLVIGLLVWGLHRLAGWMHF